eukprot:sb/3469823/
MIYLPYWHRKTRVSVVLPEHWVERFSGACENCGQSIEEVEDDQPSSSDDEVVEIPDPDPVIEIPRPAGYVPRPVVRHIPRPVIQIQIPMVNRPIPRAIARDIPRPVRDFIPRVFPMMGRQLPIARVVPREQPEDQIREGEGADQIIRVGERPDHIRAPEQPDQIRARPVAIPIQRVNMEQFTEAAAEYIRSNPFTPGQPASEQLLFRLERALYDSLYMTR